jgi:hypothetical protein
VADLKLLQSGSPLEIWVTIYARTSLLEMWLRDHIDSKGAFDLEEPVGQTDGPQADLLPQEEGSISGPVQLAVCGYGGPSVQGLTNHLCG